MSEKISRRDFIRLAGAGVATTAVLTGCGPASRYVEREPYAKMPEYTYNGESTFYATTCRECTAGCGLIVRTIQGRAIKVEGNPDHPLNLGKTCARGQATLHGLYNPDRITDPIHRTTRGAAAVEKMDWEAAVDVVADALRRNRPSELAFLLGTSPDHLFDLVSELTDAIGAPAPVRFGALGMFEARATLSQACEQLFGQPGVPFFDIGAADVVFSFGANFLETWLSPVAYTREFARMRRGDPQRRGYFVQFEPRMSQTGANADEWIPIRPGTEAAVALALGQLVATARGNPLPRAFASIDPEQAALASGIELETLRRLAERFAGSERALAIPGGAALGQEAGLSTAMAVLALNASTGGVGRPGGVSLSTLAPIAEGAQRPANAQEMQAFIQRLRDVEVKVLFIHGVNPLFELPQSFGFQQALDAVPLVISFATFPDETALQADYNFPDHHGLESWGYQRVATGSAQSILSGAQPVVSANHNTRATTDVFLAAAGRASAALLTALPFVDEVEYLRHKLSSLVGNANGFFAAPEIDTFSARFQQYGGWWRAPAGPVSRAAADLLNQSVAAAAAQPLATGEFYLVPFVSPTLAEGGANKPWLQELPDPTTTVMWNSWVEINPGTAQELGIENDDVVLVLSDFGAVEVPVYLYPAIRPDVIAIPFGQGHTAYGRYAAGRGINPAALLGTQLNSAGDLAFGATKVRISKTGRRQILSRLESRIGVYGEGLEES
jgi:anaerobic selenocysteine-containing dehydrogenase